MHRNRGLEECEFELASSQHNVLFGLYTSAANSVYIPTNLIKPTDFLGPLRNLLQRRATQLYGDHCALLPCGTTFRGAATAEWVLENFDWAEPVGNLSNIDAFLDFRLVAMKRLFELAESKTTNDALSK